LTTGTIIDLEKMTTSAFIRTIATLPVFPADRALEQRDDRQPPGATVGEKLGDVEAATHHLD